MAAMSDTPFDAAPGAAEVTPRRTGGAAGWARARQAEKVAAMSPEARILLALRLGLRDRLIAKLAGR